MFGVGKKLFGSKKVDKNQLVTLNELRMAQ